VQLTQPNLILGLSEGFDWDALRPFVESLERTSFDGEVHLFFGRTDDRTADMLRREAIILHPVSRLRYARNGRLYTAYDPPLRRFRSSRLTGLYPPLIRALALPARDRLAARARLAAPISIPYVARFLLYYRFVASSGTRYGNVMLTDVRDVFFQRDPFDFDLGGNVNCFLEDERETLGTQHYNREWLLAAYGEEALRTLGDKAISCSGVTIGPREPMLAYLRVMTRELLQLSRQSVGIDQGVHNYVVYNGLVPNVRLFRNGEGPVLTLALVPRSEIETALEQGGRLNANVLHQYNHHPGLASTLLSRLTTPTSRRPRRDSRR
jgi:hypothetical protein